MKTLAEVVELLAHWVAKNASAESAFMSPVRTHTVDARDLLDFVSDTTGISKEQIGKWVDEGAGR